MSVAFWGPERHLETFLEMLEDFAQELATFPEAEQVQHLAVMLARLAELNAED